MDFQKKEHQPFFIFFSGIKKLGHLICYNAPGHKCACTLFKKQKGAATCTRRCPFLYRQTI